MALPILINESIPRTTSLESLRYIAQLAQSVPENGVILELGPMYGAATWVLARNSKPSVKIISIDSWEMKPWIENFEKKNEDSLPFSEEAFLNYTEGCSNIEVIKGDLPSVLNDLDVEIDLYLDDVTSDPYTFQESLNLVLPKVKPGGIVSGGGYGANWPYIINGVKNLCSDLNCESSVLGQIWAFVKPLDDGSTQIIHDKVESKRVHELDIQMSTIDRSRYAGKSGFWVGPFHESRTLSSISIGWIEKPDQIGGAFQVLDSRGGMSVWAEFGETLTIDDGIASFRAHLTGVASTPYDLNYQVCLVDAYTQRSKNTKVFQNGSWIKNSKEKNFLSAFRCFVSEKNVPSFVSVT